MNENNVPIEGAELAREAREQRHVNEICPFRAWLLALQGSKDDDLAYSVEALNPAIGYFLGKVSGSVNGSAVCRVLKATGKHQAAFIHRLALKIFPKNTH